jgi:type VI secretion system protein ImpL
LLESARKTFSRVPLSNRVYSRIASSGAAQSVPPWRPADALGAAGVRVFARASGRPLTEGIPGFYTVDGFYKVLLPALGNVTKQIAKESWVLGPGSEIAPDGAQAQRLERDVITLYEADYAKQWDAMLADLSLVPLRTPEQAEQDLYILGSPQSPIRDILASTARQLTLSQPPPAPPGEAAAKSVGESALKKLVPDAAERLKSVLPAPGAGPAAEPPGKKIDAQYRALRDFVGSGPGAPIDQALKAIDALHLQLAKLGAPAPGAAPTPAVPTGEDAVQLLRNEALADPRPVSRWLEALATSGNALISGRARQQVADAYNSPSGPASLCQKAVNGRYPFVPNATNEIPLADFARLFAPGGLLDGFFNTQLQPYVDTAGANWTPRPVNGVPAPIAPADLLQFQRAAVIRDLFFAGGGNTPTVRFDITPITLDGGTNQVTLDLGGTPITYAHGPSRATQVTWPGQTGMSSVRLVFDPAPTVGTRVLQASGPWALFRLFEQGRLQQSDSPEQYTLTFQSGDGHQASFEIRAGSVQNPFTPGLLRNFQCPKM